MNDNGGWSEGESVNPVRNLGRIDTDCSTWEPDIPAAAWSEGDLINPVVNLDRVMTDASTWDYEPPAWLEVTVAFEDDADEAGLVALTEELVGALRAAAPDLGLVYDKAKSRVAGEDVVIALTPTLAAADVEEKLAGLIATVRKVLHRPARMKATLCWAA